MFDEHYHREILKRLDRIIWLLHTDHWHFTLKLEHDMAIGSIQAGQTGTFTAQLLLNGAPYVPPSGSTFVLDVTYSSPETDAILTPSADTTDVVAGVPAASTDTSLTVGASAVAPDGTTVTASDTVTVTPVAVQQVFTLGLTQTA